MTFRPQCPGFLICTMRMKTILLVTSRKFLEQCLVQTKCSIMIMIAVADIFIIIIFTFKGIAGRFVLNIRQSLASLTSFLQPINITFKIIVFLSNLLSSSFFSSNVNSFLWRWYQPSFPHEFQTYGLRHI